MYHEWDADAAQTLLEEFNRQVPPRPERPPTFMEISGYPHCENVCSNILRSEEISRRTRISPVRNPV